MIFSPLVGALLLLLPRRDDEVRIRRGALGFSLITLALTIAALYAFHTAPADAGSDGFVLTAHIPWIAGSDAERATVDIGYRVGVDGISI